MLSREAIEGASLLDEEIGELLGEHAVSSITTANVDRNIFKKELPRGSYGTLLSQELRSEQSLCALENVTRSRSAQLRSASIAIGIADLVHLHPFKPIEAKIVTLTAWEENTEV